MNTKVGLQMYTMRDHMAPEELETTLRRVKAIGYDSVQMGAPRHMTAKAFRALLDDIGLTTCMVSGSLETLLVEPERVMEEGRILGTRDIYTPTVSTELRSTPEGYAAFAKIMNGIGEVVGKEGFRLQYHSHAYEWTRFANGKTGVDILAENTDPAVFYFMHDTHWLHAGGVDVAKTIARYRGRMNQVHFKDYNVEPELTYDIGIVNKVFAEVGTGNLDWPAILEACRANEIEYYVVEQDKSKRDIFESIQISHDNMRAWGL
ncbi:MAG: sugar phosphate isomerase/epimerase [Eubacteriales bacterium]|nr:sugar phosphate isomerase/epimerase [Eubacteriales bacterium]